jgi:hypothetical protein
MERIMKIEWGLTSEALSSFLRWRCGIYNDVILTGAEYDELSDMVAVEIDIASEDWERMVASQDQTVLGEVIQ